MSEELSELQEHAEHAKHDPSLAPVSLTMAVLAVLVAVVSLTGHRAHTEEVVLQAKASDQWAFYQAKNIRRHTDELFTDLTSIQATTDAATLAKLRDKYSSEAARYKDDQKEIKAVGPASFRGDFCFQFAGLVFDFFLIVLVACGFA